MTVLACFSIKGGVGKTTTAVNLAHQAAASGYRTLLWDLDPQGAASYYLNARPGALFDMSLTNDVKQLAKYIVPSDFDNLEVIPNKFSNLRLEDMLARGATSNNRLKAVLFPLQKDYDLIVLDCPPGVSALSDNALTAADCTVVPTIPAPLSVRTLRQLRKHVKKEEIDTTLLPFFCMQDSRRSAHRSIVEYHQQVDGDTVLNTVIPYSAIVERMGVKRRPLATYAAVSAPATAYAELFDEIAPQLGLGNKEKVAAEFTMPTLTPTPTVAPAVAPTIAPTMAPTMAPKETSAPIEAEVSLPNRTRAFCTHRSVQPVRFGMPG
ncbi:MAG: ParA family protein [Pseudomonadales bacterium]